MLFHRRVAESAETDAERQENVSAFVSALSAVN
jgi:hypothetical protein